MKGDFWRKISCYGLIAMAKGSQNINLRSTEAYLFESLWPMFWPMFWLRLVAAINGQLVGNQWAIDEQVITLMPRLLNR